MKDLDLFEQEYLKIVEEGKFLNSLLAGAALAGTTAFGALNTPTNTAPKEKTIQQIPNEATWIKNIAIPFIIQWEGTVKDKNRKSYFI